MPLAATILILYGMTCILNGLLFEEPASRAISEASLGIIYMNVGLIVLMVTIK